MMRWLMDHVFDREGARRWRRLDAEWIETRKRIRELEARMHAVMDVAAVEARLRRQHPELFTDEV